MTTAREWQTWWRSLSEFRKWTPVILITTYLWALSFLNGLRPDHLNICAVLFVLYYGGPRLTSFRRFILPVLLTGIVYDSQRFYGDLLRGPIHVTGPYNFDKWLFGIHTAHGILTPNEWFQLHTDPVLDVITGFFYLFFIGIYVLFSGYFFFYLSKKGTSKIGAVELSQRALMMMWGFFYVNVLGYSTYYWYAAAPPWYVARYGLGPADLSAKASAAGCVRFDEILGTHFFTGMYGRAADVFGAIPSLHVAYPFMATYFAFRFGAGRTFAILFYLAMCFSAVYLNHHYILDIIWGTSYAILISVLLDKYYLRIAYGKSISATEPTPVVSRLVQ